MKDSKKAYYCFIDDLPWSSACGLYTIRFGSDGTARFNTEAELRIFERQLKEQGYWDIDEEF